VTCSLSRGAALWQVALALTTLLLAAAAPRRAFSGESGSGLEQESPSVQVDPEARRLYEQALVHFKNSELDEAIAKLEAAYRIEPAVELLYNLGQAHRRKGDCNQALDFYRRFLDTHPDGLARERAQARMAEMRRCADADDGRPTEHVTKQDAADASPGPLSRPTVVAHPVTITPAHPAVVLEPVAQPKQEASWQTQQPELTVTPAPSWWRHNRVPLILTATAVLLVSASGYLAWRSHQASERMSEVFERGGTWSSAEADNETAGRWEQRLAVGSGVLGLGAGAIAAWSFWRE
jgi:tetratricopeptide (TPR) repeat protein